MTRAEVVLGCVLSDLERRDLMRMLRFGVTVRGSVLIGCSGLDRLLWMKYIGRVVNGDLVVF